MTLNQTAARGKSFSYELCPGEGIKTSDFSSYGKKCTGQGNRFLEVSRVVLALGALCVWQNQAWSPEWLQGSVCLLYGGRALFMAAYFTGVSSLWTVQCLQSFGRGSGLSPQPSPGRRVWVSWVPLLSYSLRWAGPPGLCVVGSGCPCGGTEAWGHLQTFPPDVPRSPRAVWPVMSYLGA